MACLSSCEEVSAGSCKAQTAENLVKIPNVGDLCEFRPRRIGDCVQFDAMENRATKYRDGGCLGVSFAFGDVGGPVH